MNPPQSIYDNPVFFEQYKNLRDHDTGLNAALEMPSLRALLPKLMDIDILDLGCGFGDFARFARIQGAKSVTGVEISQKMLTQARQRTHDAHIHYVHSAIEDFPFAHNRYQLVVSSLAFHYIQDFQKICGKIFDCLQNDGSFVFSVEHPMCTAWPIGWHTEADTSFWPVRDYQDESIRHTQWFVDDVVKYHRTTQTYVSTLIESGFTLHAL
ncbi:bifunctional 2-polyprenyl-6-hydroxyphenol methylase/3-demethylubiquinol 3-O-methyltransferase UbiG [Snodgrassella sp. CFCC 13594]|uniref:class I SAM-dependent methyltransferase n=1 Tax=Snodgrassella sp. CFCC 13594 TaxID=1775559 RepID=UPI000A93F7A1|nr:class I SAM-dependent methyltransferase [Snodgrassella sp. CFCC 13594]